MGLPFAVVADPGKKLYAEFGVEASPRALLNPRAWFPILRGVLRSIARIFCGRQPVTSIRSEGGKLGLPADFLIASDGRILACKYGDHIYDQWSVADLLDMASLNLTTSTGGPTGGSAVGVPVSMQQSSTSM
jgi:hypothetical protein